jgi:beta-alanine degradation protein BauB
MKKYIVYAILILLPGINITYAQSTTRIAYISNDKVNIWKTIIYPTSNQILTMHRHDYDRVLVALSNGVLKITNDKGEVHELKLKKHEAYYLPKDPSDELHQDENISNHPITVMVIELRQSE